MHTHTDSYVFVFCSYMLIFLKFIQTIVPNIEYDYTGQFQLGGGAASEPA